MANYATLKAAVQAVIKTNGNEEITGANLQSTLLSVIDSLGSGYQFMGVATPSTSPGTPDYNVAYIGAAGTYANFGSSITIPVGSIGVFKYNGSWVNTEVSLGLNDVIFGNMYEFEYTFSQQTAYSEHAWFPKTMPAGTHITDMSNSTWNATIWLCNEGGINKINLTSQTLPYVTTEDYYGLTCGVNSNSCEIKYYTGSEPTKGVVDGVEYCTEKVDDLDLRMYGNTYDYTHTFSQQSSYSEHALFPAPMPVGTRIYYVSAGGNNIVLWLTNAGGTVKVNLTSQTLPYVTTEEYYGIKSSGLNNYCEIKYYTGSEEVVGVVDSAEYATEKVDSLELYTKGNTEYFEYTFNQTSAYTDNAFFAKPLPVGTYITSLKNSKPTSVIWLSRSGGISATNLSNQTLPFITDQVYYGLNCSEDGNIVKIGYSPSAKVDGLVDKLDAFRNVIKINSTDTQYQVFAKMREAFLTGNCDVYFEKATYTLDDVYNDIVEAQGTWAVGLPIGSDCRYFMNGSTIISNYVADFGSDTRNVLDCQVSSQNFELYDAILINNGGTYCVHDEGNGKTKPYIHKYFNVWMYYNVTEHSPAGGKPFGCGLGYNSTLVFDGCYFVHSNSSASVFAVHGINTTNPGPCVFRLEMKNTCIANRSMDMNLLDATRDTIEYYLCNNKWGVNFDTTNSTLAITYNNVIG